MTPKVSFCIATWKKPSFLRNTLHAILKQSKDDFEVVISDNDPAQSARDVVKAFNDPRLRYFSNKENIGMIRNFNAAIKRARGEYVIINTDDDPPYPDLLEQLLDLESRIPGYGCYFGANEVVFENERARKAWGIKYLRKAELGPWPAGEVRIFDRDNFPMNYMKLQVFPSVLWSAGIIRRDVLEKIGGVPDFGSPELADAFCVIQAGMERGFVALNRVISALVIHRENSSFRHGHTLKAAAVDGYAFIMKKLAGRPDMDTLRPVVEQFIRNAIVNKATQVQLLGADNWSREEKKNMNAMMKDLFSRPHLKAARWKYKIKLTMMRFPLLYQLFRLIKRAG